MTAIDPQEAFILKAVQLGSFNKYGSLVRPEYFDDYRRDIWRRLQSYESQFGHCMSAETFRSEFGERIEWLPVEEDIEWWAHRLRTQYVIARARNAVEDIEYIEDDPDGAIRSMQSSLAALQPHLSTARTGAVGLAQHQTERAVEVERRSIRAEGLSGTTTGFPLLDEHTSGIQPAEIELIAGRPGNAKSHLLLYGAFKALTTQRRRVSFVSPEMSTFEMGLRFDSMCMHISTRRFQSGEVTKDELFDYLDAGERFREQYADDIMFYDTNQMGRRFTVQDLYAIAENDRCDLLCVDGLLFLEPMAPYKDTRTRLVNLMDELKQFVIEKKVALRASHQANRATEVARRRKDVDVLDLIPHIDNLAESGATEQYANRVFALKLHEGRLYIAIRKNRSGPEGRIISAKYDIDLQIFESVAEVDAQIERNEDVGATGGFDDWSNSDVA